VDCVAGDLSSPPSLRQAIRGCGAVIHCAALVSDWGPWQTFIEANDRGVNHILEASFHGQVERFVHISTVDVYGYPDTDGLDETTAFRDRGFPYNSTKIAGEQRVWEAHRKGLPVTVIRPGTIYGPRSVTFGVDIVRFLQSGAPFIGNGNSNAGLVYVDNCVDLILLALDHPAALGTAFHSIDNGAHTWRDYFRALSDSLHISASRRSISRRAALIIATLLESYGRLRNQPTRPLLTKTVVELLTTRQGFSMERARERLAFVPKIDFTDAVVRTAQWLRTELDLSTTT
jgi:nucleoside-diphosphate-sugar epimerase